MPVASRQPRDRSAVTGAEGISRRVVSAASFERLSITSAGDPPAEDWRVVELHADLSV